jgi:nucleotide-binding universal stress UspA family protein
VKTLICIDGHPYALEATRLAAKFACTENSEATFLFVRRYRKQTRGYNIRWKATEIFANQIKELPEMGYLHEAERLYKEVLGLKENEIEMREPEKALIHLGRGVFEEVRIRFPSDSHTHLRIREGVPHEEILEETKQGHYQLVMMGVRRAGRCRWSDVEHVPLGVAQKAPCPVAVIGKRFEQGQPVLVCVGKEDPPDATLRLIELIAARLKSQIEVLTVLSTEDPGFRFSEKILSTIRKWSRISLKVTPKVLTGDPVKVILEIAPNYGLIICSPSKKRKKGRLGKVSKKVLCHQFNLLV